MSVRSYLNRVSGFSPFELLTGQQFPGPTSALHVSDLKPLSHQMYYDKLTALIGSFSKYLPEGDFSKTGNIFTSDWVRLCVFRRKWQEPRWSHPLKLDLTVQVQEREGEEQQTGTPTLPTQTTQQSSEANKQLATLKTWQLEFKHGDLFTAPRGEPLAHCISADCAFGAGIAKQFRDKYGITKVVQQHKRIGECAVTHEPDRIVFHLVTKDKCRDLPTYDNFEKSLIEMRKWCQVNDITSISVPRLGCGLDRLDYLKVLKIICRVFEGTEMTITIYTM